MTGKARFEEGAPETGPPLRLDAAIAAGDTIWASRDGMRERFLDYLDVRARYYEVEGRWPDSPFGRDFLGER